MKRSGKRAAFGLKAIGMRLAAVSLSLVVLGLLGETAVRVFVPPSYWEFRDASSDWDVDPAIGWVQKPGLDVTSISEKSWVVDFATNSDGVAPPSARRSRTPGVFRVMLFGDSVVVGRAVPSGQRIHSALARELAVSGLDVEVINAGVQGYSTDQALLLMERLIPLYSPDVVLYALCANDFGGNVNSRAYGLDKPRFQLGPEGRLVLKPPPADARTPPSLTPGWSSIPQKSALYRLLQPSILSVRARLGGWEERNLLGLAAEIYYRPEALGRIDWPLFAALLSRMRESARRGVAQFLFYAHPALEEVWDPFIRDTVESLNLPPDRYDAYALERRLERVAAESGVEFVPLVDHFRSRQNRGPFHLLPRDPHCNGTGYQVTAEKLAPEIRRALGAVSDHRADTH